MSEPSFHDRMMRLQDDKGQNLLWVAGYHAARDDASKIAAEADQRIAELQAKLAEAERERDALRILAERNYPGLKRSGFCSKSHGNDPLPVKLARAMEAMAEITSQEHTLYCIGGSLDGQVRTERGDHFINRQPQLWERYDLRVYPALGPSPQVAFWVLSGEGTVSWYPQAAALYVNAAVLADEQQIHT